ncbi:MAG: hypothetical protein KFB96_04205 [Thiocapsa sp.]|nr:MAG: hypothetical protein KFB96_04205 [Thiocapsa sp.]
MNPNLHPVGRRWLREGHHGGARALQGLALNLDNGRDWPVDMGQVCGMSDEHRAAALSMLMDDRNHGEPNEAFMARCREIATERREQPQTAGN